MASFLKSRAESVRNAARSVLIKMMLILGCKHFASLVKEMRSILARGYQLHVLVYTIHAILHALINASKGGERRIQPGDIDSCITSLVEVRTMYFIQSAEQFTFVHQYFVDLSFGIIRRDF